MPNAARLSDQVLHDAPHCHAPIHPPAPTPTPVRTRPYYLPIMVACVPTVMVGGLPAAVGRSQTIGHGAASIPAPPASSRWARSAS